MVLDTRERLACGYNRRLVVRRGPIYDAYQATQTEPQRETTLRVRGIKIEILGLPIPENLATTARQLCSNASCPG